MGVSRQFSLLYGGTSPVGALDYIKTEGPIFVANRTFEPYAAWLGDVPPAYHHREPSVVAALARDAGLALVEERVDDLAWDFGSADDLSAWLSVGFADWLRPLPEDRRPALVAEAADEYAAVAGSPTVVRFLQLRDRFTAV